MDISKHWHNASIGGAGLNVFCCLQFLGLMNLLKPRFLTLIISILGNKDIGKGKLNRSNCVMAYIAEMLDFFLKSWVCKMQRSMF